MLLKDRLWFRLLSLGGLIILGGLLGNMIIIATLYVQGADINGIAGMGDLISRFTNTTDLKAIIGINHIMMFTASSIAFLFFFLKENALVYLRLKSFDIKLLLLFIALLVFSYPIMGFAVATLEKINLPEWAQSLDESSMDNLFSILAMDGFGDLVFNMMIVAALPAIGEELLFRGIIQNEFMKRLSSPHLAIIVSAIIFSAFHLEVIGFIPKLLIGIILGYSYYITGSLWVPIILHFLNNGSQVISLYAMGDEIDNIKNQAASAEDFPYAAAIVSVIICYFVARWIINVSTEKPIT